MKGTEFPGHWFTMLSMSPSLSLTLAVASVDVVAASAVVGSQFERTACLPVHQGSRGVGEERKKGRGSRQLTQGARERETSGDARRGGRLRDRERQERGRRRERFRRR